MMNKPLLFLSPIKKKSECNSGYHRYSHRCGIALLKKAFSHIGKEISEYDILMSEKGKPYIDGSKILFNISHCDGLAVCVLSDKPVGVDCESVRKASTAVMKKCFGNNEADYINNCENRNNAFTRIWTLKESAIKCEGKSLADLGEFSFGDYENFFEKYEKKFSCLSEKNVLISVCGDRYFDKIKNVKTEDFI